MTVFSALKRFVREFFQYKDYIVYYIKALEKSRVSNTTLGYLWWFLDPLLNMAIYVILVRLVFNQRDANYPVFFFSAMLVWRYFSMAVQQSTTSITSNLSICKDNYVPKFIFPLALCVSSLTPFLFSLIFLFLMMLGFQTPITIYLLYTPLLILILFIITCTFSMISAHINVFMNDFSNILPHLIMIGMFATPIFYDINMIPNDYIIFMKLNPLAVLTTSFRNIFTYGTTPPLKQLLYLLLITIILFIGTIYMIYKNDQTYNRYSR